MTAEPPAAVVVHGFTGGPQSVQGLAGVLSAAGVDVHVPLLPGHGTTVEDLEQTGWADWLAAVEAAYDAAAAAGDGPRRPVLMVGLSMGGSLACRVAAERPGREVAGLVLVNPFIDPPVEVFRQTLRNILAEGITRLPGITGDIADPAAAEKGYAEMPIEPLLSLCAGLDDLLARLGAITCPVLLFTSRVDHVVPNVSSDILAERVGGPVERLWLERSWHVATLDHDRDGIERRAVLFASAVTGWGSPLRSQPVAGRLSREDVLHVARLARLALSDEEVERFTDQLGAVLEHAADVAALDTAGVPPTAHPLPVENVFRDDVVRPSLDRDEVLAEAPAAETGMFKVPPILGVEP